VWADKWQVGAVLAGAQVTHFYDNNWFTRSHKDRIRTSWLYNIKYG